jgi:hypothetical protein
VRDDGDVRGGEGGGELLQEVAGAGVLVGLEDADEAAAAILGLFELAEGAEGGLDLGRVVAVVVVDADGAAGDRALAEELHAAVHAAEAGDGVGGLIERGAGVRREDAGHRAVEGVVLAGEEAGPAGDLAPAVGEGRKAVGGVEGDDPVGLGVEADGLDAAGEARGDLPAVRVVVGDDQDAALVGGRQQAGEFGEGVDDVVEGAVDVEVVGLDG